MGGIDEVIESDEERLRKIEDTLLLLPSELRDIKNTQVDIVEHLETINGSIGEFDDRVHIIETLHAYEERDKKTKKEEKDRSYIIYGLIIALIAAAPGVASFIHVLF